MSRYFLFWVILSTAVLPVTAQEKCTLKLDRDSIRVYTCVENGKTFKSIKSEFHLKNTLTQVVAAILDVDNYSKWQSGTDSVKIVKKINDRELMLYTRAGAPFPANDRDLIVHLTVHQDPATRVVQISAVSVPDYLPRNKDAIRIPYSREHWTIQPNKGQLEVTYRLSIDLGGNVPAWLVNLVSYQTPHDTFLGLRKFLRTYHPHPIKGIVN